MTSLLHRANTLWNNCWNY